MSTQVLFPTLVYQARLRLRGWQRLNARLLRECRQLRADDAAGRRWSVRNYPGGYTSYNSAHRMHRLSPTFASLARELDRHVAAFARRLQLDLTARALTMTDCWVNVMGRGAVHGLHLHPLSTISGTYYVAVPEAAKDESARQGWIKFGEPSLDIALKNPVRRAIQPVPGRLVLFPSYMWHGTVPFRDQAERTTIAFDVVPQRGR